MAALRHSIPDAALVARVVSLGCLAPAYTREQHPGFWERWSARATDVVLTNARGGDITAARAECDLYSGQPLSEPESIVDPTRVPFDLHGWLFDMLVGVA